MAPNKPLPDVTHIHKFFSYDNITGKSAIVIIPPAPSFLLFSPVRLLAFCEMNTNKQT